MADGVEKEQEMEEKDKPWVSDDPKVLGTGNCVIFFFPMGHQNPGCQDSQGFEIKGEGCMGIKGANRKSFTCKVMKGLK